MKTAIAIILIVATFFATVLWSCCCVASRADRQMGIKDTEDESG